MKMKRIIIAGILLITLVAVSVGVAAEAESIDIVASPHTLNLGSHGNGVTVHTNIAYADVNGSTVTIAVEGAEMPIRSCYSDLCGDLVVKVDRDDVVGAITAASTEAEFILAGNTNDGATFAGNDTIRVIDVATSGSKK